METTEKAELKIVKGDATNPIGEGNRIIIHICNDIGAWGAGFVLALSRKWSGPEKEYRKWSKGVYLLPFELGNVQFVKVEKDIWVANMIAQTGIRPDFRGKPPVRYEAIKDCFKEVREFAGEKLASIHMPRIGCGLAGGKWEKVEEIVRKELVKYNFTVIVYDL